MALRIEELDKSHNRRTFDCGDADLNFFLKNVARQKNDKQVARTYVLINDENDPTEILGFFTVIPSTIEFPDDHRIRKRVGDSPPAPRLARLGVQKAEQGRGLGKFLVIEAFRKVVDACLAIGGIGCAVDAKNKDVKRFYEKLGFEVINQRSSGELSLWLPLAQCVDVVNLVDQAQIDDEAAE